MEEQSLQPIELLYCYAYKDRELRDELHKHLAAWHNAGRITCGDHKVVSGISWRKDIESHFNTAENATC